MNKEMNQPENGKKLTIHEHKDMLRRWIFNAGLGYNFETQQAPVVTSSMRKALRKIHPNDDEYIEAMDNHYKYFDANPLMVNIILGATSAMEEKDGTKAKDVAQSLKTSLMGPFSGVGDSVFWTLIPAIMGSTVSYMALQGNAAGAILRMLLQLSFHWLKMWFFKTGYDSGTKLIISLGEEINIFTDAISVIGLMVVGSLIPIVVKVYTPLKLRTGKVMLSIQGGVLDKIMPALLPVAATGFIHWLLGRKKWTPIKIILLIIVICLAGAATGILGVAK